MTEYIITVNRNGKKFYLQSLDGRMIVNDDISLALSLKTAEDAELRKVYLQVKFPDYLYGIESIEHV